VHVSRGRVGHDVAATAFHDLARPGPVVSDGGEDHVGGGRLLEHAPHGRIAVQLCRENVVEAVHGQLGQVLLGYEVPIGDEGDPAHPEAHLEVLHHARKRRTIGGVAGEHMMGDRDAVRGDEQPDHDLGPSERWSLEYPNALDGNDALGVVSPST